MSAASQLRFYYLAYLSRPASDRVLYRLIHEQRIARILELGIADWGRTQRMLEVALQQHPPHEVHYSAFDPFEARPGSPLSLKSFHRELRGLGVQAHLVPGELSGSLPRVANQLRDHELVIINEGHPPADLELAYFYLPRMITTECRIYRQLSDSKEGWQLMTRLELEKRARQRRRAA